MKKLPHLARALAFVSLTALLAGCKTTSSTEEVTASIPSDYRLRHPIAVREKTQTMTVFIGDRRGTLTPAQRVEVSGIASNWRQDATGGIVIEIPVGASNERAATGAAREIRSILGAAGVPHHAIEIRPYQVA
jgi:pilus assembly protein CpaD